MTNQKYYWQCTATHRSIVSAERARKLKQAGEMVWPVGGGKP